MFKPWELRKKIEHFHAQSPEIWLLTFNHPVLKQFDLKKEINLPETIVIFLSQFTEVFTTKEIVCSQRKFGLLVWNTKLFPFVKILCDMPDIQSNLRLFNFIDTPIVTFYHQTHQSIVQTLHCKHLFYAMKLWYFSLCPLSLSNFSFIKFSTQKLKKYFFCGSIHLCDSTFPK